MKKRMLLLLAVMALLLTAGCGKEEDSAQLPASVEIAEDESEEGEAREGLSGDSAAKTLSGEAASEQSLSERIAVEISYAEEQEKEVEKKQEEAVTQPEMNETAKEMYRLWDDALNGVWRLLEANLNEADMEVLRKEEREWIASKDAKVQAAGLENGGGSMQPLVEAMKAAELTKERVYELAEYAEEK
ncbi:MAG: DUF1311 domain-containing protein [Lachnospiraceae bacterium]|jgi:uncharacterized protein YecT (DUF1311 family)|nr:DUF1311 domain-containing protein [Lachnospiraceae bacterium]